MLDRVALHQTRLRVPGLGLDGRGVALGDKGVVLLPSIDRLVALLAIYTESDSLDRLLDSLTIQVVRSKLGTREILVSFDAGSSERMDRIAAVSRLAGGFTFTGSVRHFVQYRDAVAPFGYDAREITPTSASVVLYHSSFSQTYDIERPIELARLLLRLMPRQDPRARSDGSAWLLAEPGLGPSLVAYLARSAVPAQVGIVEAQPGPLGEAPLRRWLVRVDDLPRRMVALMRSAPGITAFSPVAPGAAVEWGFRHPIDLAACPAFDANGLVLFGGRGALPVVIERLPVFASPQSLQRAALHEEDFSVTVERGLAEAPSVRVPLRLVPDVSPPRRVHATLVAPEETVLLRQLIYALGARFLRSARFCVSRLGVIVVADNGVDLLPLGLFYESLHPNVFIPSGMKIVPAAPPDTIFAALGAPADRLLFFRPDGTVFGVKSETFAPLDSALLEPQAWTELAAGRIETELSIETPSVWLEPLGVHPLRGAKPAKAVKRMERTP
jgi:hypothetical protein